MHVHGNCTDFSEKWSFITPPTALYFSSPAEDAVYTGPDNEESRRGILEFNIAI